MPDSWPSGRRVASSVLALTFVSGCANAAVPTAPSAPANAGRTQQSAYGANPAPSLVMPLRRQAAGARSGAGVHGAANVFVADGEDNAIFVYDAKGDQTGILKGGGLAAPLGLATDGDGKLYVANAGASNILVYAPPYTAAPSVLDNGGVQPSDVAVDVNGNVATVGTSSAGSPAITLFEKGATSPSSVLDNSTYFPNFAGYCGFDRAGNLFFTGNGPDGYPTGYSVGEVVGGVRGTTVTPLSIQNQLAEPGGIQIARDGSVVLIDQRVGREPQMFTYAPPVHGALGDPKVDTPLVGASDPVEFKFEPHDRAVVTADNGLGSAERYAYPSGGSPERSIVLPIGDGTGASGIALVPSRSS